MTPDGSDDRDDAFVAEYEPATAADIIDEAEPPADGDDDEGAVAGSITPDVEVTPQAPTPENTLFVALGIYLTILALADTTVGLDPRLAVGAFVAIAATTAACYGVLVKTTPDT
jgi:hypothetical protein